MRCFNVALMAFAVMTAPMKFAAAQAAIPLVDIKSVDPTILVELRYAGRNNLTGHPLYPLGTRALVRPEVASRLSKAKTFLRHYQYRLQIAMRNAGFYGLPTEWWHFTIANWQEYLPPEKAKQAAQVYETHWQDKL